MRRFVRFLMLGLVACGPSKTDATAYLESEGLTKIELKPNGKAFDFTATDSKTGDLCTGNVTVSKGFGTTKQLLTKSCGPDTRACKAGAPDVCVTLADQLYAKEAKVFPTAAAECYRMACADKNGHACTRAAEFEAIDKHYDKLREFAAQGCDFGDADGCTDIGLAWLKGDGGAKEEKKALELLKKGCDNPKPSLKACRAVAGALLDATPPDNEGAKPYADKACQGTYKDGCIISGVALFRTKDYAHALPKLEPGCADATLENRGLACNLAGAIYFDGLFGKKDQKKGLELFEKSCATNEENGCKNAARAYEKGLGTTRDAAKAKDFTQKACKARGGTDCG